MSFQDVCDYFRDTSEDLLDGDIAVLFHWMMAAIFGVLAIAFSPILITFLLVKSRS